jgi:hypothetical protein
MNSDTRSLPNYGGKRSGEFAMFRNIKVSSWHKKNAKGVKSSDNKELTDFLVYNNSRVSTEKRTSGQVVDASDYIKFKKIGAATRDFGKH